MTLPSQEVHAIETTREFLRDILTKPRMPMKVLRDRASSCLHHYPFKSHIDMRWSVDVCEHGNDRQWCQECDRKDSKCE